MHRRNFCKTTLAAAVAAAIPGCGQDTAPVAANIGSVIPAISLGGEEISIETAAVTELAESLYGRILLQSDNGYDAAKRVWIGMFVH